MPDSYIPILIHLVVVGGFAVVSIIISHILGPRKSSEAKLDTYESGVARYFGNARLRFPPKFYVVALFFLIFDVEVIFLFPWAIVFRKLGLFGFVEMMVFLFVLAVGLVYIWRKGGLDWK
jgi:NADH-quinone oxidoreductase subunit A